MATDKKNNNLYPVGSKWRKWDLHIHTPGTKLYDGYKISGNKDVWDVFCDKIEQSDVEIFGITDYFSADCYKTFIEKYRSKYPRSKKRFFLNIELRLNESVNKKLEEVNVHLIFNPSSLNKVDKFVSELKVVKTGKNERPIKCSELKTQSDYQSATVMRGAIQSAFEETFGKKAIRCNHFLVFAAANYDGIRAERGVKRKEIISDEIDKFSDGFFGGTQNQEYFLNTERLEDKELTIGKKPVITDSDAHSFDDLDKFLGRRALEKDKNGKDIIIKDVTWIKADPTFEGLKQILYEPEPGDRVWIGPIEPDKKNEYQIIRKIKFYNTDDFPEEIVFNKNLCSTIGSRSSGKSALLAYIAHSIDKDLTERLTSGPGEGEDYHWKKIKEEIKICYSIEWNNALSDDESPGKIVYIPQNYLFNKSKDSEEIKNKIEPVLFKRFPDFEIQYKQSKNQIDTCNKQISKQVENWFRLSDLIVSLEENLKDLGNKEVIKKEKQNIESKIDAHKKKYQLSKDEVKKYQEISTKISEYEIQIKQIKKELSQIAHVSEESYYFNALYWNLAPDIENLPKKLQETIIKDLQESRDRLLEKINQQVIEYKKSIGSEREKLEEEISKIKKDNKTLLEKYQKNIELEELIKKLNEYEETIKNIDDAEKEKKNNQKEMEEYEKSIEAEIEKRESTLVQLKEYLDDVDRSIIKDIRFGIEYGLNKNYIEKVANKVNLKYKTDFVEKNELNIEIIRKQPAKFLRAVYSGEQKINVGNDKKEVVQELLMLTENILFTAEMEGDRIGGFSETTMTPGRRALFLLKLILAESEDRWPILIDQPEDNLDSRSITDEIVPFLKKKKKERQIIMISHNANLVIGADSEQIIVANRHGSDRQNEDGKQFNYLTGSIEYTKEKDKHCKDTLKAQGVREHACDILDGGKEAFEHRRNKYNLTKI